MTDEERYVRKRLIKANFQSLLFYFNRVFAVKKNRIVFTCIEGTTGYTCNPKYIAKEIINRNMNLPDSEKVELIWLVDDDKKEFPQEITKIKNTLWNRAHYLSTAKLWIDNSRKQLECRKRENQVYIQTWHAKLGFKPTGLDRGETLPRIAYLVSKHDSDMVDYWLSNSKWYDELLPTGSIYNGDVIKSGSPRCDILVKASEDDRLKRHAKELICEYCKLDFAEKDIHFMMYAPTFRGGSQGTNRNIEVGNHFPQYALLKDALEKKFGGTWIILLRLHPQLVARNISVTSGECTVDISKYDDMYELLAGCDAFMTDYSSAAFDAMVTKMPVFLYCDDYSGEYESERGKLLWNLKDDNYPFILAENDDELYQNIITFDKEQYELKIQNLFSQHSILEDGNGSKDVVDYIYHNILKRD